MIRRGIGMAMAKAAADAKAWPWRSLERPWKKAFSWPERCSANCSVPQERETRPCTSSTKQMWGCVNLYCRYC